MTKLMERALEVVRDWTAERQDDAAELLLALDRLGADPYPPSPDDLAAVDEALAQLGRGERATDAEVEAAFARFRS